MREAALRLVFSGLLFAFGAASAFAQPMSVIQGGQQGESDWERAQREKNWKEGEVKLPAYPKPGNLIGFEVSAASDFKFFIDSTSLSVGDDGVVRYSLVARSPSDVDNVSYEGMHCRDSTYKVYAFGRSGGTWMRNPLAEWRPVETGSRMPWHRVLAREYFCPQGTRIASASVGISALRRGGNPDARGYMPDR